MGLCPYMGASLSRDVLDSFETGTTRFGFSQSCAVLILDVMMPSLATPTYWRGTGYIPNSALHIGILLIAQVHPVSPWINLWRGFLCFRAIACEVTPLSTVKAFVLSEGVIRRRRRRRLAFLLFVFFLFVLFVFLPG